MLLYEEALTEKELISMVLEKAPGNEELTKEFYNCFWEELKEPFITSIRATKSKIVFILSQKQAVIRLVQKKDRDKTFNKNRRPISFLNIDHEIVSKTPASRLKKVLPSLITHQQTAHVQNR